MERRQVSCPPGLTRGCLCSVFFIAGLVHHHSHLFFLSSSHSHSHFLHHLHPSPPRFPLGLGLSPSSLSSSFHPSHHPPFVCPLIAPFFSSCFSSFFSSFSSCLPLLHFALPGFTLTTTKKRVRVYLCSLSPTSGKLFFLFFHSFLFFPFFFPLHQPAHHSFANHKAPERHHL